MMTRRQLSYAIRDALKASQYASAFTWRHGCFCLNINVNAERAQVCLLEQSLDTLLIFPDQIKEDTIVVSTDVIRLQQDMDEDSISEKLREINSNCRGIRYEMPFLYHAGSELNRAVLVIKYVDAVSYEQVSDILPQAIEDVLKATEDFQNLFSKFCQG